MKIGYRNIKTTIAVILAMYLGYWLDISSYTYAGVVAAIALQATRRQAVFVSLKLFASALISILLSTLVFWWAGFQLWLVGVLLLFLIPVLVRFKIERGVIISLVVMLHVFNTGTVAGLPQINTLILLIIGIGTSLIVNLLYMPDTTKKLEELRRRLLDRTSSVFQHMYRHLTEDDYVWSGRELLEIAELNKQGKDMSLVLLENSLLRNNDDYYTFFRQQEKRLDIIERMAIALSRVDRPMVQTHLLASLFRDLSEQLAVGNLESKRLIRKLRELEVQFKAMDLPATREEFEVRAALLQVLRELENYLTS